MCDEKHTTTKAQALTICEVAYRLLPLYMTRSDDVDMLQYWSQSQWKDLFLETVDECVPVKVIRDTNSPPWIDREVKLALRRKYYALSYTNDWARILRSPLTEKQQKLQPKRLNSLMLISALCLHHPSRTKRVVCHPIP